MLGSMLRMSRQKKVRPRSDVVSVSRVSLASLVTDVLILYPLYVVLPDLYGTPDGKIGSNRFGFRAADLDKDKKKQKQPQKQCQNFPPQSRRKSRVEISVGVGVEDGLTAGARLKFCIYDTICRMFKIKTEKTLA